MQRKAPFYGEMIGFAKIAKIQRILGYARLDKTHEKHF